MKVSKVGQIRLSNALFDLMPKRQIFGGLDLSQTTDTSALCLIAPPEKPDGYFEALFFAWCPSEDIEKRSKIDRLPYDVYARAGWIKPTEGPVVNTQVIEADIMAYQKMFGIKEIGYDVRYAIDLSRRLEAQGCNCTQIAQGYALSPSNVFLSQQIARRKLCIHGNPLATWHFSNLAVNVGPVSGDVRLDKQRARERIDLGVACSMALFVYLKSIAPTSTEVKVIDRKLPEKK